MRTWRRLSLIPTFSLCGNYDLALQPSIDVLAHHIFSQIVLSELTPPLFDLTLSLLPISFDEVPVHLTAPTKRTPNSNVATWLPFRMPGKRTSSSRQTRVAGSDEGRRASKARA